MCVRVRELKVHLLGTLRLQQFDHPLDCKSIANRVERNQQGNRQNPTPPHLSSVWRGERGCGVGAGTCAAMAVDPPPSLSTQPSKIYDQNLPKKSPLSASTSYQVLHQPNQSSGRLTFGGVVVVLLGRGVDVEAEVGFAG
jgi:hypothetical protein